MSRSAVLLLFVAACGGSGPSDAGADGSGSGAPLDLARAEWRHSPVYSDSSTFASSADLAISASGEMVVAWAEDVGGQTIETAIFVADGGPEFESRPVIGVLGSSFTRPTIFAGTNVHVAASGPGGATGLDIFYARRTGGAWSPPVNITAPGDVSSFVDHDPEVLEIGGETIVLYRSRLPTVTTLENNGIYMRRFTDPQSPGPASPVLDRATFDCDDFEAVVDNAGALHLIANCDENDGGNKIIYLTNKSGAFVSATITAAGATSPLSPDIAVGRDGNSVHLLWNASTDCGGITCRDVYYSKDLAPPVSVSGEEDGGFIPHVAVDSLGRVIVVFHRLGDVDDVLWTYSESSSAFVRTQLATPGTPDSLDFSVGNLVIDPVTDRPHMVYVHGLPGPGGSNVFHGELTD